MRTVNIMMQVRIRRAYRKLHPSVPRYVGIAALFAMSGCVAVVGTPEGIRAYGDSQNGLVTNGKASADIKSAYWQQREQRDKEDTVRDTYPGFLSNLFGGGTKR